MRLILILLVISLVFVIGCRDNSGYNKACFNSKCIELEVMRTLEEKQNGLMFRESLDYNKGLLFLYEEEGERNFWMKNVKFPIDIIFLDKDDKIIHIETNVPSCLEDPCPIYSPNRKALNVIEVNSGFTIENNINVGDMVGFV